MSKQIYRAVNQTIKLFPRQHEWFWFALLCVCVVWFGLKLFSQLRRSNWIYLYKKHIGEEYICEFSLEIPKIYLTRRTDVKNHAVFNLPR